MGTIKQGILGGFSGKVGGIVGTSWKGIGVMKAMPLSVANPKTAKQVNNRDRNTAVLRFAQAVGTSFIRTYWNRFAKGMSGFNDFMSVNYAAFDAVGGVYQEGKMFTSVGKLLAMVLATLTGNHSGNLVVTYTARSAQADYVTGDLIDVVFFNQDKQESKVVSSIIATSTTTTTACPAGWEAGDVVTCFVSSRRLDGTAVSTSVFMTIELS